MSNTFHPTLPQNRIKLLDVFRGLAMVGVLLSNIVILSGYVFTPFVDLDNMHLAKLNSILNIVSMVIIKGKFYPMLMILFGAGLYMQFQKSDRDGFLKFFSWRMFLLLLIGLLHQTFWAGDVVTVYALFAFLLIPVRNLKPKNYLVIAVLLLILHFIASYIQTHFFAPAPVAGQEHIAGFQLPGVLPNELIAAVQNEGIKGLRLITGKQSEFLWTIPRYIRITPSTIMLFVLGAYLFGSGFFTEKVHKLKYLLMFLGIGIAGSFLMFNFSYSFSIIGNLFIALAYMSLVALLMTTVKGNRVFSLLAPLGRMALTNYIMQSVICITIFYGVGLGFFGKLPLYMVYLIAIVILVFQILFSKYWLQKFQFGPLEMLWRKLSYGKAYRK